MARLLLLHCDALKPVSASPAPVLPQGPVPAGPQPAPQRPEVSSAESRAPRAHDFGTQSVDNPWTAGDRFETGSRAGEPASNHSTTGPSANGEPTPGRTHAGPGQLRRALEAQVDGETASYRQGPTMDQVQSGSVLRRGHRGQGVQDAQSLLNQAGAHPSLAEDGRYGPLTRNAVRDHQRANGLRVDGKLGPDTLASLRNATSEVTVTREGERTVVDTGNGNDDVRVSQGRNGGVDVSVNGQTNHFSREQAENMTIRGGAGNDSITIDDNVTQSLTVEGGDGHDTIRGGGGNDTIRGGAGNDRLYGNGGNDRIEGGAGRDYMEGGAGNDQIQGGAGNDTAYGLDGNDQLQGGAGRDYLDGGRGNDRLQGGAGGDQLMGGRGDDQLQGGAGRDTLAGGHGTDEYRGGAGRDRIYHQSGEQVHGSAGDHTEVVDMSGTDPGQRVTVRGDAAFRNRVESDLDALRSLPTGRGVLSDIDNNGRNVTIEHRPTGGNATGYTNGSDRFMTHNNTTNGPGTDATVRYNPSLTHTGGSDPWDERPPIVGLHHELVHGENAGRGAHPRGHTDGTRNRERIAVGLSIDHDGDPSTARIQPNDHTENDLRRELGLRNRDRY